MYRENNEVQTEINKQRMTWVVLLYLWTPILLFILTWMKIPIAAAATLAGLCALSFGWSADKRSIFSLDIHDGFRQSICYSLLCFCFLYALCVVSGIGGYAPQTEDWIKHNTILRDLVEMPWPVWYNFNGEQGALVYYIGAYLVPALIGKLTNFNVAVSILLWWSAIGLFFVCVCLYLLCGKYKPWNLLLIAIGIVLFSSFYAQCRVFFPDYSQGYYGSHLQSLQQVTPQFIATLLTVALWLLHRHNYKIWGIILVPLMLYSTFAFLGFCLLVIFVLATEYLSGKFEKDDIDIQKMLLSPSNVFTVIPFLVILLYICSNVLQEKPNSSGMEFKILSFNDYTVFLSYALSWILWFVILYRSEHKNVIFWAASVSLLLFPLLQMGKSNDLCNKGSMPALAIICFLVIRNVILAVESKKLLELLYCSLLIFCLYIAGIDSVRELYKFSAQYTDFFKQNHKIAKSDEDFYLRSDQRKYQYIAWDLGGLLAHKAEKAGVKAFYFSDDDMKTMKAGNTSYSFFTLHHLLLRFPDNTASLSVPPRRPYPQIPYPQTPRQVPRQIP